MTRIRPLAIPALLMLLGAVSAQEKSVKPGINDHFKNPDLDRFLKTFEGESREIFSQRKKIVEKCKIKPGMVVADIGAGTGLFTRMFAVAVGPKGKVYAVDIAKKFLDHIDKTCKEAKLPNVKSVVCSQTSTNLPANSIDLAFICDTYHHFEFPQKTLDSLYKAMKPGGQIILIDFHRIPGKSKKWTLDHVRAGQEVFVKEIVTAGFKKTDEVKDLLKENYFVRFVKVEKKKDKEKQPAKDKEKPASKDKGKIRFNRDIRPILSDACFHCHGPDKAKRKAKLRLDTEEGGKSVVVAGKPEESDLIQRITHTNLKKKMPPEKSGRKLNATQIALLKKWIEEGAKWEPHWAYIPPVRPDVPSVKNPTIRNPIDAFIQARLDREGLALSPEAPRTTLIRRLSLDLTGLPPTLEDVDAYLADKRPGAYGRVVDRLLASPRFGERLTLDWLDAARYADSNGYQSDRDRIMWPWRDWVVKAFNRNQPFDQFTIEQIAGDLLPKATLSQKIATGFHRNHMLNGEGGRVAEESRVDYVIDRVDTTATVWLGLTLACSRCHDHKYDPFTQKNYYQLFAFYNNVPESGGVDRGGNANPVLELPTRKQKQQRETLTKQIRDLEMKLKAAKKEEKAPLDKQLKAARASLTNLNRAIITVMVMEDRPQPRQTHILIRGAWDKPGDKVSAGVIEKLAPLPKGSPVNRLGLARWLVDAQNPLTARVIVNRYWQLLFGTGIVKTVEDFGVQGEPASHQELLDWLAVEFRASGWDLKHLLRLMVTSATYRQSSKVTPALREKDPQNRLLARAPRYRLPSTIIRDQALATSGLLVQQVGGKPVKPYQPPGIWEEFSFGYIKYQQGKGDDLYRRSLYTFWRRTVGPTNLFDTSMRQVCEVKATRTNTPVHALITLNETTYVEAARNLAQRVMKSSDKASSRLITLFRLATARMPTVGEQAILTRALARLKGQYQEDESAAKKLLAVGESRADSTLNVVDLAAYTGLASLILNLDETITRE